MRIREKILVVAAIMALGQGASQGALSQLSIGYYNNFTATVYAQGYGHSTYATAFAATQVGGDPLPSSHSNPFVTFCLDINNIIQNGWWRSGGFSDIPLANDSNPADRVEDGLYRAASLYAHFAGGIMNANGTFATQTGNATDGIFTARETGAALQLAIWEVLYEKGGSGYSIDQNNAIANSAEFYVSSVSADIRNLANSMLSSQWNVVDRSYETTFWNAANSSGDPRNSQDLIGPMSAVPEPTTVIAGVLLLLPFLASTIRRKVKSS